MKKSYNLQDFNDKDVICFGYHTLMKMATFRSNMLGSLKTRVESAIDDLLQLNSKSIEKKKRDPKTNKDVNTYWLQDGVDCEVLTLGSQDWKQGKIKVEVKVEFIPETLETLEDEVEEDSLDDIRREIQSSEECE